MWNTVQKLFSVKRIMFICYMLFVLLVLIVVLVSKDGKTVQAEESKYTVTFIGNGGTYNWYYSDNEGGIDTSQITVDYNDTFDIYRYKPDNREGYHFDGYRVLIDGKESEILYIFGNWVGRYEGEGFIDDYKINCDVTFVAQWSEAYKLTFRSNEGYISGYPENKEVIFMQPKGKHIKNQNGNYEYSIYLYNRPGYVFAGWKIDGEGMLYKEKKPVFTDYENLIKEDLEDGEEWIENCTINKDMTFLAEWEESCEVTFLNNIEGENRIYDMENVAKGDYLWKCYSYNCPDRDNKVFKGWKVEGDDTLYVAKNQYYRLQDGEDNIYNYQINQNTTFVAQWEDICVISFDLGGYANVDQKTIDTNYAPLKITKGSKINKMISNPKPLSGWVFKGWKIDGSEELYNYNSIYRYIPQKDTIFHAVYERGNEISFDLNGGQIGTGVNAYNQVTPWTQPKGKTVTDSSIGPKNLPEPDKDGYVLRGWKNSNDNKVYSDSELRKYIPDDDVLFTAVWKEAYNITVTTEEGKYRWLNTIIRTYTQTVTYKIAKGETVLDFGKPEYDKELYARGIPMEQGEKYLAGFEISGEEGLFEYDDVLKYVPSSDITITARYKKPYYITINGNGRKYNICGEERDSFYVALKQGEQVYISDSLPTEDKDGNRVIGYRLKGDSSGKIYKTTDNKGEMFLPEYSDQMIINSDMEFIAVWDEETKESGDNKDINDDISNQNDNEEIAKSEDSKPENKASENKDDSTDRKSENNSVDEKPQNNSADQKAENNSVDQKQENDSVDINKDSDEKKDIVEIPPAPIEDNKIETPAVTYSNEWVDGKWYGADGSQTYEGTIHWVSNSTGWWIEDSVGWYPTDTWQKIDGVWYYFKPDGYMASNEYYGGYWFNADGSWDETYYIEWKSNSTGWWIEDISGWWPSSCWLKIDDYWYYFDGSGYMVTNQYIDGYWLGADGVCY